MFQLGVSPQNILSLSFWQQSAHSDIRTSGWQCNLGSGQNSMLSNCEAGDRSETAWKSGSHLNVYFIIWRNISNSISSWQQANKSILIRSKNNLIGTRYYASQCIFNVLIFLIGTPNLDVKRIVIWSLNDSIK